MRGRVFTAAECRCRFHFTIYPGEFIRQRPTGRVWYRRRLLPAEREGCRYADTTRTAFDAIPTGNDPPVPRHPPLNLDTLRSTSTDLMAFDP